MVICTHKYRFCAGFFKILNADTVDGYDLTLIKITESTVTAG